MTWVLSLNQPRQMNDGSGSKPRSSNPPSKSESAEADVSEAESAGAHASETDSAEAIVSEADSAEADTAGANPAEAASANIQPAMPRSAAAQVEQDTASTSGIAAASVPAIPNAMEGMMSQVLREGYLKRRPGLF